MKRTLKIAGLVAGVLVVAVIVLLATTFLGRQSISDGVEIDGIRIVKDGFVSVGVVPTGPAEVALIDAGNDRNGAAILAELARRRLGSTAVSAILLTHGHPDHIAAAGVFQEAQVFALAAEVPLVEGRAAARGPLPRLFPVKPTGVRVSRPLNDGETLAIGQAEVRVFAVPGHTAGSAAYLVNGVLFVGDSADANGDGELQGAPWLFSDSQPQNRASLVSLEQRLLREAAGVKAIVFAHSGVLSDGLAPLAAFARSQ